MRIRAYLKWLSSVVRGWLFVLWIYLNAGWRFCGWRFQFWYRQRYMAESESTQTGTKRTLLFIRHGQTTWNVEHRLPGQLPGVLLNDTGRQQAERLADALTVLPISAIISSPLERARETAEIVAKPRGIPLQLDSDLMDLNVGHWAGQVFDELSKNDPDWKAFVRDPTVAPEGVETFPQVQERVVGAVNRWLQQDSIGNYPAFIAHADVIKLLLAHYTGLETARAGSLSIDNASVSIIEVEGEHRPRVVAVGWNPHPGWLKLPTPESEKTKVEGQQEGEQKA
jgi:broad specificity phosphatase PhoE